MKRAIYRQGEGHGGATNSRIGAFIVSAVVVATLLLSLYSVYDIFLNA